MSAKRALTSFRAPDETAAEDRAWQVVRSAHAQTAPAVRRRSYGRPAVALVGALLVGALVLSPAAATVGHLITRALGIQHAAPRLLALPSHGRVLVSGPDGTWTVSWNGSSRRIGPWSQASWSPHGRYLTVSGTDELSAVNPEGVTQWTLARPAVGDPRWFSPSGYRVAYLSGNELRVVAGDGLGDHLVAAGVARVPPAWRPGHPYQVAYVTARGAVSIRDADTRKMLWSSRPGVTARKLIWAADGQRLLAVWSHGVLVYDASGRMRSSQPAPDGLPLLDAALSPDGHTLAAIVAGGRSVTVRNLTTPHAEPRTVLAGSGLGELSWSPDGRWLLVAWPAADQWVFVRVSGRPRLAAVSRIAQQFSTHDSAAFPTLDGWCCSIPWARAR
jgi:WD40 repeat protein